jgi:putative component of membrane protein insertase Oxa1/YidC/SpoIIIJ protein YidD
LQGLYLIRNNKYIFLVLFFLVGTIYSQSDWVRWEKSNPTYQIKNTYLEREYNFSIESASDMIIKPVINAYWFFISDVDGANCPFNPSCSSFLMQSLKETNIFQGTLMFFDRFTRDTNIFGRSEHYPRFGNNHFYDPVTLYTLDEKKIKFIPANTYISAQ